MLPNIVGAQLLYGQLLPVQRSTFNVQRLLLSPNMFLCIPILFGCQTKIQTEREEDIRICRNCHNASVVAAKSTTWFELFFIPLVPISKKHVWICHICHQTEPLTNNDPGPTPAGAWMSPGQSGYNPVYIQPTAPVS